MAGKKSVLIIGETLERNDFSDPAIPKGMTPEKIRGGLEKSLDDLRKKGHIARLVYLDDKKSAPAQLNEALGWETFDVIVVGAGLRIVPKQTPMFEVVMNIVHAQAPQARIAFNVAPDDSANAAERLLATMTEIKSLCEVDDAAIARAIAVQRESRWGAKRSSATERIAKLERLRRAVVAHADLVNGALAADLSRPPEAPASIEVGIVLADIDHAVANLERWMAPVPAASSPLLPLPPIAGTDMFIHHEAKGIVLVFGAWNQPFMLLLQPIIAAVAAGNTVIAKPNELTPVSSRLVATILREAFDEQDMLVFEGGVELADRLLELPVDHIFFTGSPAVGRKVAAAAARHLASVTLELGGKSPAIIDGSADMKATVSIIAGAKLYNAGQVCISFDHVWIQKDHREEFVRLYQQWLRDNVYDGENVKAGVLTHMVNGRNFDRVAGYLDDALARGASVIGSGRRDRETLTIEPALLIDVPWEAQVMQDEIFGPVLPIIDFDTVDEVIARLRSGHKPLAVYAFTTDRALVQRLLQETSSGGMAVNGWASHAFESMLPFGGIGNSGSGYYRGEFGFRELSHARSVVILAAPFDSVSAVQG